MVNIVVSQLCNGWVKGLLEVTFHAFWFPGCSQQPESWQAPVMILPVQLKETLRDRDNIIGQYRGVQIDTFKSFFGTVCHPDDFYT